MVIFEEEKAAVAALKFNNKLLFGKPVFVMSAKDISAETLSPSNRLSQSNEQRKIHVDLKNLNFRF